MGQIPALSDYQPTVIPQALLLKDANLLLDHPYLPLESGFAVAPDGMHHAAATTYMRHCTGAMVDWWFGFVHTTAHYLLWHPRDHIFSDWEGPRDNASTYIGGHHLVHEYIGAEIHKLRISFLSPAQYFGENWEEDFRRSGYSTAVCGRVGAWNNDGSTTYFGHLIHLIKDEPDGCRMRSRFWLGDVGDVTDAEARYNAVPKTLARDLTQHCVEEMAILASRLPSMHADFAHAKANR